MLLSILLLQLFFLFFVRVAKLLSKRGESYCQELIRLAFLMSLKYAILRQWKWGHITSSLPFTSIYRWPSLAAPRWMRKTSKMTQWRNPSQHNLAIVRTPRAMAVSQSCFFVRCFYASMAKNKQRPLAFVGNRHLWDKSLLCKATFFVRRRLRI